MIEKSELDQLKLSGRIYPAIISCVNNRWKIMLALFAYYSFAFRSDYFASFRIALPIDGIMTTILIVFIIQNFINYYFNANEQIKIERKVDRVGIWTTIIASKIEIFFDITAILSILLALKYLSLPLN